MKTTLLRAIVLLMFFTSITAETSAQIDAIKNRDVTSLFSNNKELWIKKYTGMFDGVHPITMAIATNGDEWRGIYRFESSKTQFIIEAEKNNNILDFVEINSNNEITGHLIMQLDGVNMAGTWRSEDGLQNYPVSLMIVKNKIEQEIPQESFVEIYSGMIQDERAELTYVVESSKPAKIELSINNQIVSTNAACANDDCTMFTDSLSTRKDGLNFIKLKRQNGVISIILTSDIGKKVLASLTLDGKLDYQSYAYIDFAEKRDLLFPKTGTKFDEYFDGLIEMYIKKDPKIKANKEDAARLSDELLAWVDIHYYDAKLISGLLFYKLDTGNEMTIPFTYDLIEDKDIRVDELFSKKNIPKKVGEKILAEEKLNTTKFDEPAIQEWYTNQKFDLITINQEGVAYNTEYNTIAGTQTITIPYVEFEKYIRKEYKNTLLKK